MRALLVPAFIASISSLSYATNSTLINCSDNTPATIYDLAVDTCKATLGDLNCEQIVPEDQIRNCDRRSLSSSPYSTIRFGSSSPKDGLNPLAPRLAAGDEEILRACITGLQDYGLEIWSSLVEFSLAPIETIGENISQAWGFASMTASYLWTEYERARNITGHAGVPITMGVMTTNIATLIVPRIEEIIEDEVDYFQCLNNETRANIVCKFLSEILIPPIGGITLLKAGRAAAIKFPNVARAFAYLNNFRSDIARLAQGENLLGRNLHNSERQAIIEAHRVGENQPGRDGTPAGIGNYTRDQLRRKGEILREAGLSDVERGILIRNGIVGKFDTLFENIEKILNGKRLTDHQKNMIQIAFHNKENDDIAIKRLKEAFLGDEAFKVLRQIKNQDQEGQSGGDENRVAQRQRRNMEGRNRNNTKATTTYRTDISGAAERQIANLPNNDVKNAFYELRDFIRINGTQINMNEQPGWGTLWKTKRDR